MGLDLWIKRDDLTGFALGGNKGRKLEFIGAAIQSSGAEAVVGCGASQSNFLRQLSGVCSILGLPCHAVCMDYPFLDESRRLAGTKWQGGNMATDTLFGTIRHLVPDGTWDDLDAASDQVVADLERQGKKVFQVPLGGSSPLGIHAFVEAGKELDQQVSQPFDFLLTASSSGSTQVGLTRHFHDTSTHVIGISADPEPEIVSDLVDLSVAYEQEIGKGEPLKAEDFDFRLDYVGEGYGVESPAGREALQLMASREAILLDRVYTAKAFSGLIDLARRKEIGGRVLFWHTGGTPTFYAHSS